MVHRQACCSLFEPHSGSLYRTYEFDEPDEDGFVTIHSCMCEPENFKEQCGLPDEIEVPLEEDSYQDKGGSVQYRFVRRATRLNLSRLSLAAFLIRVSILRN